MEAFKLSVPEDFVTNTLTEIDWTNLNPSQIQSKAIDLYIPVIVALIFAIIPALARLIGNRACLNNDVFVEWQLALLITFLILSTGSLVGLCIFIYANGLVREGVEGLVKESGPALIDRFSFFGNISEACPIANVTAPIVPFAQGFLEVQAYMDFIQESFDTYASFYDNTVLSTIIFLITFSIGMLVNVVISLVVRKSEGTFVRTGWFRLRWTLIYLHLVSNSEYSRTFSFLKEQASGTF